MAEREGFEPPIGLHLCRISSAVHSTTLPPLRAPRRVIHPRSGRVLGEDGGPDKAAGPRFPLLRESTERSLKMAHLTVSAGGAAFYVARADQAQPLRLMYRRPKCRLTWEPVITRPAFRHRRLPHRMAWQSLQSDRDRTASHPEPVIDHPKHDRPREGTRSTEQRQGKVGPPDATKHWRPRAASSKFWPGSAASPVSGSDDVTVPTGAETAT